MSRAETFVARLRSALFVLAVIALPVRAADPVKLAFVDTGNTGRSVTAEALANREIARAHLPIAVISRAVDQDPYEAKPEANVVKLLSARGIDVSAHRAAQLTAQDVRHSDVILTMTAAHKEKVIALFPEAAAKTFTLADYAGGSGDVADAFGKPMATYQAMLKQVEAYLAPALTRAARDHAKSPP
jgi:protein arginine phosphatase